MNEKAMEMVSPGMRRAMREYAALMQELAGAGLAGLTAYGSVLGAGFDHAQGAAARSVLVLKQVDLGVLRRIGEHGAQLGKKRISAPVVMSAEYIRESLDTFALELIEIQQRHATIVGEDHFADLQFDQSHVRLQCEREFKLLMMRLRRGLLATAGREAELAALQLLAGEDLLRLLRGLAWLRGRREALGAEDIVAECEKWSAGTLRGARGALRLGGEHGWGEFTALYHDVERLAGMANAN